MWKGTLTDRRGVRAGRSDLDRGQKTVQQVRITHDFDLGCGQPAPNEEHEVRSRAPGGDISFGMFSRHDHAVIGAPEEPLPFDVGAMEMKGLTRLNSVFAPAWDEERQELIDAIRGQWPVDWRRTSPGSELSVDAMDRGLVGAAAVPEMGRTVGG